MTDRQRITPLTSSGLMEMRGKALRCGVWFRFLDCVERAVVNLTIRCTDRVRSPMLARILANISAKLLDAMKSQMVRMMESVGRQLAQKTAQLAASWGNKTAKTWAENSAFIRYLTVIEISKPMG
jgi:hypothetical protein